MLWLNHPQKYSNYNNFGSSQGTGYPRSLIAPIENYLLFGGFFMSKILVQTPGYKRMPCKKRANDDESLVSGGWHFEGRQLRLRTQPKPKPEGEGQGRRSLKV